MCAHVCEGCVCMCLCISVVPGRCFYVKCLHSCMHLCVCLCALGRVYVCVCACVCVQHKRCVQRQSLSANIFILDAQLFIEMFIKS